MRQRFVYVIALLAASVVWTFSFGDARAMGSKNGPSVAIILDNSAMSQIHGMTGCPALSLSSSTACANNGSTNCNGGITTNGCPGTCMTPCGADNSAGNSGNGNNANGYLSSAPCTTTYAVNTCIPGTITGPDGQGGYADYPTCNCNGSSIGNALPCAGTYTFEKGC